MASIFEELGVRPVLNAMGNRTLLGGSTPSAAVRAMMDEAEEDYVHMGDLMDTVGLKIAEMIGAEAALVTSGCSAALAVGAAACMTGNDQEKIDQLPDTTGMPNEFIIQRQLRIKYDRCITIPGGKLVEVGDVEETRPEHIEAAIGPRTAGIHYLAPGNKPGALPIEEVIRIGQAHDIPVIVDAAGEVYPTDKFGRYVKMGAKLAAYGAKYFGAVNSSGMLVGDKDLVEIARALSSEPKLILLDEPASGLSVEETQNMAWWIEDMQKDLGLTVLMVEHDMSLVSRVSNRVLAVAEGRPLAMGKIGRAHV